MLQYRLPKITHLNCFAVVCFCRSIVRLFQYRILVTWENHRDRNETRLSSLRRTTNISATETDAGRNILQRYHVLLKKGGDAGFYSEMRVYPAKGLALIIMTNQTEFYSRRKLSALDEKFIKLTRTKEVYRLHAFAQIDKKFV